MPLSATTWNRPGLALRLCLAVLACLLLVPAGATPPPLSDFSRRPDVSSVKISPDGAHLAVRANNEGKAAVVIMKTDTLKPVFLANLDGEEQVGAYHWANNERILLQVEELEGWEERPRNYGEWYAVNIDGKNKRAIYGFRSGKGRGGVRSKTAEATRGTGVIVDLLEEDPKHVLIGSHPWKDWSSSTGSSPELLRVNIYNGRTRVVDRSPVPYASFLTDQQGKPRFVSGSTDDGKTRLYYRTRDDSEWILRYEGEAEDGEIRPLAFKDQDTVWIADNTQTSTQSIYTLDLLTGERKLVYHNEDSDPSSAWFTANGRNIYALEYETLLPSYVHLNRDSAESKLLSGLLNFFSEKQVRLTSQTKDGNLSTIMVFSDREPPTFFLFNRAKKQVRELFSAMPWIDTDTTASVQPIEFTARDGLTIRGYLTLPHGVDAVNLPMVVNPHGGPHGPRDWWGYKQETQMLASRGIVVLTVNFRGSGGYGTDFEKAGYRHWGDNIQHDIIDATRHVIEAGYADKDRVCIYGGSFGGYSALQAPIVDPDLFACTVGFVGVYDLQMMYDKGDIPERQAGVAFLEKVIGRDVEQLRHFSPAANADKLNLPILLIHGEEDQRVPIEQAETLRAALDKEGISYEWMVMKKEGHGFYNDANRTILYARILEFLGRHLGIPKEELLMPTN